MRRLIVKILLRFILILAVSPFVFSRAVFAEQDVTLSINNPNISVSPMPNMFKSADEIITVSTTSSTGYTVSMRVAGETNDLVYTLSSTSYTIPTFTLPTGSTSAPVPSLGYGYGYSIDGGSNYSSAPTPGNLTQLFETFSAGINQHTLTFGVKVDQNTVSGTYTNTFVIVALAKPEPCAPNSICYDGNNDDKSGTMTNQTVESNASATLMASNFSRPGYGFAGWNTEPDGSGTNYGPSQTIQTGNLSTLGLQLYAKWVPSAGNLQDFNGCSSMTAGDVTALTDTRDGNTYAVAKFADNHCWMIENLRLDLSDPDLEISEINTNNPTSDFAETINEDHPASTNSFCEATNPNASCVNQILFNTNNINRELPASYNANNNSSSWYSYGVYYNWYTATAGYGNYSFSTTGSSVDGDICPAGWRLPTGYGSNGDYSKLDVALGGNGKNQTTEASSARWRVYPANYIYSGEQRGETGYNRDVSGAYSTSNTSSAQRSLNLWLQKTAVSPNSNSSLKPRGQTIRCIMNESYSATGSIHYDNNGGTGSMPDETDVNFLTATAANNGFTKAHSEFKYWNTKADGSGTIVLEGGSVANAANDMGITDGGTLTLYAIWQSVYDIRYYGNGADTGSMDGSLHGDLIDSVNLIAPNFLRSGYGFIGWSLDASAATKLANGQNVKIYGPNERVVLNDDIYAYADADNIITFYAVWLEADDEFDMQDFSNDDCIDLPVGNVMALTDTRDGNTYAVAKLADNRCWMIENLRLIPSSVSFSNSNTNSPTSTFISEAASSSSSDTLCGVDSGTCDNTVSYNTNNINGNLNPSYNSNVKTSMWYSYGVMYNWYTATAGNGTFSKTSGSTSGDICPTGWELPTGGSSGRFKTLNTAINSGATNTDVKLRNYPNNFIYSGDFNKTVYGGRSTYGRYWSSTAANGNNAYRFGFTSGEVTPIKNYNKWDAFAVRCVAK